MTADRPSFGSTFCVHTYDIIKNITSSHDVPLFDIYVIAVPDLIQLVWKKL